MANQPEIQSKGFTPPELPQPVRPAEQPKPAEPVQSSEAAPVPMQEASLPVEMPHQDVPAEQQVSTIDKAMGGLRQMLGRTKTPPPNIPTVKDDLMVRVEKIMEEDLADAFTSLPTVRKQEFKIKGERTAYEIRDLLNKTHVKIKKIFKLILEWLLLLPGINKFYLEQEAKIKADKILALKQMTSVKKK